MKKFMAIAAALAALADAVASAQPSYLYSRDKTDTVAVADTVPLSSDMWVEFGIGYSSSELLNSDAQGPAVFIGAAYRKGLGVVAMRLQRQSESTSWTNYSYFGNHSYYVTPSQSFTNVAILGGIFPRWQKISLQLTAGISYCTVIRHGKELYSITTGGGGWFSSSGHTEKQYEKIEQNGFGFALDAGLYFEFSDRVSLGSKIIFESMPDAGRVIAGYATLRIGIL